VAESCSCPNSQKASTKWCYHAVGVALYVEWQRRLHPTAPVALGTLRAGTLPLPPVTVDERLAQAVPNFQAISDDIERERLALGTMHDATALATHHMPQEDLMSEDEELYIPEPSEAPQTILEPPAVTRPLPGPVLLPSLDAQTLERSMQSWSAQRQVVKRFLHQELVEGTDYYTLRIKGRETKPALSKAGSEKFLALFQLHASFAQDTATWTMLGEPQGTLCYVCTLHTRGGEIVGEGRGARTIQQDGGDINKAVKMAQKSSCVDAILRTGALSDVFTQDLEPETTTAPATPTKPQGQSQDTVSSTAQALRQRIWARVQQITPEAKTREEVTRVIMEKTGLALHPDHYADILITLED
jgi:hypothetical protein